MDIKLSDFFQLTDGDTRKSKNITLGELKSFFKPKAKPETKPKAKPETKPK